MEDFWPPPVSQPRNLNVRIDEMKNVLKEEKILIISSTIDNNTLNVLGCASPAIDPELYYPVADKKAHRKKFNLPPDINIVGTVMRNQRRKLFFELMKAFKIFLETAPPEVAKKTFLYLHTSYPEPQGWDIAEGILEFGLASKVLTTYICRQCKNFHCSIFQDAISVCPSWSNRSAVMPSVGLGLSIPNCGWTMDKFN